MPPEPIGEKTVRVHGPLNKSVDQEKELLISLFRNADVLSYQRVREGFVIAVLEAAAFGLPVVAYDTIGVNTAVRHGETGILLNLGASAEDFADVICGWMRIQRNTRISHEGTKALREFSELDSVRLEIDPPHRQPRSTTTMSPMTFAVREMWNPAKIEPAVIGRAFAPELKECFLEEASRARPREREKSRSIARCSRISAALRPALNRII